MTDPQGHEPEKETPLGMRVRVDADYSVYHGRVGTVARRQGRQISVRFGEDKGLPWFFRSELVEEQGDVDV